MEPNKDGVEISVENEQVQEQEGEAGEANENNTPQAEPKRSQSVERAEALGWMPLEQWKEAGRDEDDWKPAKVFLEHGEMIGKIRTQSRELDEHRQALRFMNEKNKQVYETGYKAALTELRAQKREALAEGDLVKADEIDEKIDATKDELAQVRRAPPVMPRQPDPEHAAWLERNPWYSDGVMQKFADSLAIEYINVNRGQVTPADVRDYVEKEVKKEFAHKFKPKTQGAPSPDGEGRTPGKKSTSTLDSRLAKAKAEMSESERNIMKTMLRSTGLTEAKYLEMYIR